LSNLPATTETSPLSLHDALPIWFFLTASRTYGLWNEVAPGTFERSLSQATLNDWWYLAIPALVALVLIAGAIWLIGPRKTAYTRSEEHTSELQSRENLVCRLLLE